MRQILFRAISIDGNDKFYYGDLEHDRDHTPYIYFPEDCSESMVDSDTVGEFTGMYDNDGKMIFEGDIVQNMNFPEFIGEVVWKQGCWCIETYNNDLRNERIYLYDSLKDFAFEIVGNIHQNLELSRVLKHEKN